MRVFLLLSTLCVSAAGFTLPLLQSRVDVARCSTPEASLGRRAVAGTLFPAIFLGAKSAEAKFVGAMAYRKADQSAIGVSQVEIPSKGEGNTGAKIPSVPIDTSGWQKTSVWGVNGAEASENGSWYSGGESQKEKDALLAKSKGAAGPFPRLFTDGLPAT